MVVSPQCIVGNSPSPPWDGGMGLGGLAPHQGWHHKAVLDAPSQGREGLGGHGWVLAGSLGQHDVRQGRELAQVDKAVENRNPRSGGRVPGHGGRLQVGTGPGWGPPAPWVCGDIPGYRPHPTGRTPAPPCCASTSFPPPSSRLFLLLCRLRHGPTAAAAPQPLHPQPCSPAPPPRHPLAPLTTAEGPGTSSQSPAGPKPPAL